MAIIKTTIPHGFLARFTPNGAALQGAQIDETERLVDDSTGELILERAKDPRPVTPDDASALALIASTINAAALVSNAALIAQVSQLTSDKAAAEQARDAAQGLADTLDGQLTVATGIVETQRQESVTLTADRDAQSAARASAEQERDAAIAQVTALQAQLAVYQAATDVSGVPTWVYRSSFMKALFDSGKKPTIEAALAAMPGADGEHARIDYATAAKFYRKHPTILALIAAGLFTATEVDAVFIAAMVYDQQAISV